MAVSVLNKHVPGISSNPMVAMVQGMSLNMIVGMPQAAQLGITEDKVEAILAEGMRYIALYTLTQAFILLSRFLR